MPSIQIIIKELLKNFYIRKLFEKLHLNKPTVYWGPGRRVGWGTEAVASPENEERETTLNVLALFLNLHVKL